MHYKEIYRELIQECEERNELIIERIRDIATEETVPELYRDYFRRAAAHVLRQEAAKQAVESGEFAKMSMEELAEMNRELYREVYPENYGTSYANPAYAVEKFGREMGQPLCLLYSRILENNVEAFNGRHMYLTYFAELLVQIYNCFEDPEGASAEEIVKILYSFFYDNSDVFVRYSTLQMVDPELDFVKSEILEGDLEDLRYLYRYGLHVTENQIKTAQFINSLPEEEVQAMADTYTEGYRIGFENGGKDITKKRSVCVAYSLGFERMMKHAMKNFERMGLQVNILDYWVSTTSANRQFGYDHKSDAALYFDKHYVERRLECMKNAYESAKKKAAVYGGPALIETFGEKQFDPVNKPEAIDFDDKQHQLNVYFSSMAGKIKNEYIPGDETSFTIIAYPIPEIGDKFEEIFRETVKINTLDYVLYRDMQQKIIDVLDQAEYVHVAGRGKNKTDLTIAIHPLDDPSKQTAFENCVADVNIPVGEVFTSPRLKGTNGKLHVTQVYLNGLRFVDLDIDFKDGMIEKYSCGNFDTEEENHKYMFENVLAHHDTIPMGEFAIGTNTTAYRMGIDYDIQGKLPILIAEKTGPHFAVGDTCYSHSEDTAVFNPDGKEIVARDNEITLANRNDDPMKAYFNCHTDITIPYDELDTITVIRKDGSRENIIENGRFVVPGTEILNEPLDR